MECSICFGECDKPCELTCSHSFCKPCLVQWLASPTQLEGPSCPMCRGPILFKGLQKIQGALEEKRWNAAYDDTYAELFDELVAHEQGMSARWLEAATAHSPTLAAFFRQMGREVMTEHFAEMLEKMDRTFQAMKTNGEHPELIKDLIFDGDINYEKEVKRARRHEWKGREPSRVHAPQRRTQMRRFV